MTAGAPPDLDLGEEHRPRYELASPHRRHVAC
jgi:hypothetical protein